MNGVWSLGHENYLGGMLADTWLQPWHRAYAFATGRLGGVRSRIWLVVLPDYGMFYQFRKEHGWGDWIAAPPGMCLDDLKQFLETLERLND